jgi:hypothetical protein
MSQKSLLTFAITLILASSGCIDFENDNQEIVADDKQEPVGETNMTSLEKRIEHLESMIAEYEQPKVYFVEFNGDDIWTGDDSTNLADDGNLFCWYYEYLNENRCLLVGMAYDVNGIITAVSWESSESGIIEGGYGSTYANNDHSMSYVAGIAPSLNVCNIEIIEPVNQTLSLTVYDNDGNSASASYDLDYDSACTVIEPDNEGGTDFCDDGEEKMEGGMIWSCNEGEWVAMASIVCGSNEFVSNHTCVPCPGNTTNEAGDPAPLSDTTCDENEPPIIWSFTLMPKNITEETTHIATNLNATDPEGSSLSISADVYLNGQMVDQAFSELLVSFVFDLSEYNILSGDGIHVYVTVMDDSGQSATEDYFVIVEEESED